ncbi:MAG TPA: DUF305 domain-containing protein [Gemmatimonadales bacterium]|jgi:uncharacterized protein (DUF305 family)|nr:DUF305 domain-containing protein [Gemmatimonadales bacterium]
MSNSICGRLAGALALAAVAACAANHVSPNVDPPQGEAAAIARAHADSIRHPYTKADIDFMSGMIYHHAQAIVMAGWADSNQAGPEVKVLCGRIINAQRDEIRILQGWLQDRHQPIPEPRAAGMPMMVNGTEQNMLMPGMLSPGQMTALHAAKGADFDRLFLHDMIQHHQGAVQMVKDLFGSVGAAEDDMVFKLAAGINVDQTTEIARMQKMLTIDELFTGNSQ